MRKVIVSVILKRTRLPHHEPEYFKFKSIKDSDAFIADVRKRFKDKVFIGRTIYPKYRGAKK